MILNIQDDHKEIESEFLVENLCPSLAENSLLVDLLVLCNNFDSMVDLSKLEFFRPNLQVGNVYTYKFKTVGNRSWNQTITFIEQEDQDPFMIINTNQDAWKLSEFIHHRLIRDKIVKLRAECTMDKFTINWN